MTEQPPIPQKYYMLLIPKHGDLQILSYEDHKDMVKMLTVQLRNKEDGTFDGDILLFHGVQVEYSDPIMSYRVNIPTAGELSVSEGSKGKYLGYTPAEEAQNGLKK